MEKNSIACVCEMPSLRVTTALLMNVWDPCDDLAKRENSKNSQCYCTKPTLGVGPPSGISFIGPNCDS